LSIKNLLLFKPLLLKLLKQRKSDEIVNVIFLKICYNRIGNEDIHLKRFQTEYERGINLL